MSEPKLPSDLKTPQEKADYCRGKAMELLKAANNAQEPDNKITLLNLSEQWMMLGLFYEKKTKEA